MFGLKICKYELFTKIYSVQNWSKLNILKVLYLTVLFAINTVTPLWHVKNWTEFPQIEQTPIVVFFNLISMETTHVTIMLMTYDTTLNQMYVL